MKYSVKITLIILAICGILNSVISAQNKELYLDPEINIGLTENISFSLKENLRFKDYNNYYRKTFVGISSKFSEEYEIGIYYNLKQIKSDHWINKGIIFPQLFIREKLNRIRLIFRQRMEYHVTDNFYRYRLLTKIVYPLTSLFSPWVGDEIRYFFDKKIIGENEILIGMLVNLNKYFKMNIFYDNKMLKNDSIKTYSDIIRMAFQFYI